ncbi:MAG TPA: energy transducer TonB [Candidatus Didemnitutus sp.]|jgi:protein TonB
MKTKLILLLSGTLAFGAMSARADDAVEAPVPVRTVAPRYPDDMRRDRASGVVTVSCTIDEKGNVTDPKVEKATNVAFSQPALDALRKWKFKPAKKGGNAIPIHVILPIQFTINSD